MVRARVVALAAAACLLLVACEADKPEVPAPAAPVESSGPAPVAAGPVLAPATRVGGPLDVIPLDGLLDADVLGKDVGAVVMDAGTGAVLLDRQSGTPRTPASVLKLATAAAVLATADPALRLRTTVVDDGTDLVLVGGGDTTLTSARLRDLADSTVEALAGSGRTSVRLLVDDTLYAGAAASPDWRPSYVSTGVVAPVSALAVDGGRVSPRSDARSADPAIAAGRALARLLDRRGVAVTEVARGVASSGAAEVAALESPALAELVEQMLLTSDNDLAESLLRQVALAAGADASFASATRAAVAAIEELGVSMDGLVLLDGSGLARGSRIAPRTVADLLALAADPQADPRLDPLLTGLPVAGFSGTLADRYGDGRTRGAAGLARAKTGTLTGVSTLAGVAEVDAAPLVFVVMADAVPGSTLDARDALDRFVSALLQPR